MKLIKFLSITSLAVLLTFAVANPTSFEQHGDASFDQLSFDQVA